VRRTTTPIPGSGSRGSRGVRPIRTGRRGIRFSRSPSRFSAVPSCDSVGAAARAPGRAATGWIPGSALRAGRSSSAAAPDESSTPTSSAARRLAVRPGFVRIVRRLTLRSSPAIVGIGAGIGPDRGRGSVSRGAEGWAASNELKGGTSRPGAHRVAFGGADRNSGGLSRRALVGGADRGGAAIEARETGMRLPTPARRETIVFCSMCTSLCSSMPSPRDPWRGARIGGAKRRWPSSS